MKRRRRNDRDISGILVLDKPPGITSHDLVRHARRVFGTSRVGHAGTLDPLASGLMVLLLGSATRVAEYVQEDDKEYEVTLLLGRETDTQDVTGATVAEATPGAAAAVTRAGLAGALASFTGTFSQVPPVFSAVKVGGQPLYKAARKGEAAPPPPRVVTVRSLRVDSFDPPRVRLTVACSKGTYMRTLCHDVGRALGVGGCLEGLRRTRSGAFTLERAVRLDDLLSRPDPDSLLIRTADALPFPRHEADGPEAEALLEGRPIPWAGPSRGSAGPPSAGGPGPGEGVAPGSLVTVLRGGEFLAVAEAREGPSLVPRKVFPPRDQGGADHSKSLCKSGEKC